jgi:hypothetical protein
MFPIQAMSGLLIRITQHISFGVQKFTKREVTCERVEIDLKVQGDIAAGGIVVIEGDNGAGNIAETSLKVLLLPRPEETVEVGVMQVEDWVSRGVVGITHGSEDTTYAEVATT